jgi:hypothetical protein
MVCGELARGYVMATLCTDISLVLQPARGRVSKQEMLYGGCVGEFYLVLRESIYTIVF